MKYANTSRILSLVFHALILVAFAALGVYFAFFVAPFFFAATGKPDTSHDFNSMSMAYNLYAELGVIGLAMAAISAYGLINAIKGFLNPTDDKPVIKAFAAFFAEGYTAAGFFLLQAALFFNLTANGNNIAFIIIMAVIITIILLIATNIPMVRTFDGRDNTDLTFALVFALAAVLGALAIVNIFPLVGSVNSANYNGKSLINTQLLIAIIAGVVGCALAGFASFLISKKGTNEKKGLASYFTAGATGVAGIYFLTIGLIDAINSDNAYIHLNSHDLSYSYGSGYSIMSCVIGGLLIVGALVLVFFATKEPKKPAAKA